MATITLENLAVSIRHKKLFSNINLSFKPGEIWGILGPNGAGKTTLLHTIAGLLPIQSGKIFLNNKSLKLYKPRERAKKMGLLLQENEFPFPSTVLETVMLGRYPYQIHWFRETESDKKIAMQALSTVGIAHLAQRSVIQLSGGEKRRLEIATLLTQDPDILLLDEPTNHLDMQQQSLILSLLKKTSRNKKKTVIMVLHDIHAIKKFCDHVLLLGFNNLNTAGKTTDVLTEQNIKKCFPELIINI